MSRDAAYWIRALGLKPHPEGGYFAETYRSGEEIPASALPPRFGGARAFSTAIYFLLEGTQVSALHRLDSDEIWHFYAGSSLTLHVIHPDGRLEAMRMGAAKDEGEAFQAAVPAGAWFGATVDDPRSFTLVGCTVAPGFSFDDFQLATRAELTARFPRHRAIIERLTKA